ncbi:MAG TPA: response regulator transcription factor [Acetobacteraceae bacterium]|jgi:DNA-binding CsgD family transcriptional regulator
MSLPPLRVALHSADPLRRRGLAAMLEAAGHTVSVEAPDVVLCDLAPGVTPPGEAEAPVLALADTLPAEPVAGVVPRAVEAPQLDAALRAVAAGLIVRAPGVEKLAEFRAAEDTPALTPREVEILTLVGQGLTNKAVARKLGISVHTVKFHLEAMFAKLEANSRAEAVVKGLRGGAIEL